MYFWRTWPQIGDSPDPLLKFDHLLYNEWLTDPKETLYLLLPLYYRGYYKGYKSTAR